MVRRRGETRGWRVDGGEESMSFEKAAGEHEGGGGGGRGFLEGGRESGRDKSANLRFRWSVKAPIEVSRSSAEEAEP